MVLLGWLFILGVGDMFAYSCWVLLCDCVVFSGVFAGLFGCGFNSVVALRCCIIIDIKVNKVAS